MKETIRVSKLKEGVLGSKLQLALHTMNINPNTKLWIVDEEPVDVDSLSIQDLQMLLNGKQTAIVFKACDDLMKLAEKHGRRIHILYEGEIDEYNEYLKEE
jgi:hypothetical protein